MVRSAVLAAFILILAVARVHAAPLPTMVGQCSVTEIAEIGSRLEGVADSGSAVSYKNGGVQVSYDELPGLRGSRVKDRVRLCLVSIPEDCPPGDDRGRVYRAKNLRTGKSWEAPDSQHMCGGA
jgi:hypothetical protein